MGKIRAILMIVIFSGATNAFSQNQIVFSRTNISITNPLRPVWRIESTALGAGLSSPYKAFFYISINAPAGATVQNVRFTWNIRNVDTTNPEVRDGQPFGVGPAGRTVMQSAGLNGSSGAGGIKNGGGWSPNQNYGPIELQFRLRAGGIQPSPAPRKLADFTIVTEATINGQTVTAPPEAGEIWLGSLQQQQQQQQRTPQQQWQQLQQQQLGTRIQGRGFTTTLYTRFNPKTGIVEVTKNGIISHRGFLNLQVKDLNRRQSLRNYRYR